MAYPAQREAELSLHQKTKQYKKLDLTYSQQQASSQTAARSRPGEEEGQFTIPGVRGGAVAAGGPRRADEQGSACIMRD